ncbi:hypothetical protein RHM66_12815 [Pseudomonas sp. RTB3]|nr:hypothetical protein RHM66_12815 [Pseudomonas sp. RTB3]
MEDIVEHLHSFLQQLPALIERSDELGNRPLAEQFAREALPVAQAAELLWHAHLAGHPSDYLQQLQQRILACTRGDLLHAARQLQTAAGGWRYVANGPRMIN